MEIKYQISIEEITEKLHLLGYQTTDGDLTFISYILKDVISYVSNFCYLTEIPTALNKVIIDLTAGKFLKSKIATGVRVNELIDFSSRGISSITEGDVTVSYSINDPNSLTNLFMAEISKMCDKDRELIKFRKIRWN